MSEIQIATIDHDNKTFIIKTETHIFTGVFEHNKDGTVILKVKILFDLELRVDYSEDNRIFFINILKAIIDRIDSLNIYNVQMNIQENMKKK